MLAMLAALDDSVGRVVAAFKAADLYSTPASRSGPQQLFPGAKK
jgi:hypothetical protein